MTWRLCFAGSEHKGVFGIRKRDLIRHKPDHEVWLQTGAREELIRYRNKLISAERLREKKNGQEWDCAPECIAFSEYAEKGGHGPGLHLNFIHRSVHPNESEHLVEKSDVFVEVGLELDRPRPSGDERDL